MEQEWIDGFVGSPSVKVESDRIVIDGGLLVIRRHVVVDANARQVTVRRRVLWTLSERTIPFDMVTSVAVRLVTPFGADTTVANGTILVGLLCLDGARVVLASFPSEAELGSWQPDEVAKPIAKMMKKQIVPG